MIDCTDPLDCFIGDRFLGCLMLLFRQCFQGIFEKALAPEEDGAEQDGTVKVGDFVKYQITTRIPEYPADYSNIKFIITDTMTAGLELQNDSTHPIKVDVGENKGVESGDDTYTLTAQNQTEEELADLTIDFFESFVKAHGGESVTVTYYAKVTEAAVAGIDKNTNKAKLEYSHKPGETNDADSTVIIYTFNIKVQKFTDEVEDNKALAGAEFELWNSDMTEKIENAVATGDDGTLTFDKLDEGVYYLKETKAPNGYTLLANPIKVEITAAEKDGVATGEFTLKINDKKVEAVSGNYTSYIDVTNGTAVVAVENHKGFSLPATGGAGIALFLIVGVAGILTVSVVITKKTKKSC